MIMIYIHLLTWVGFGLIAYVPNTLYNDAMIYLYGNSLNPYKQPLKANIQRGVETVLTR
jgi:hypothetical protein